MADLCGCVADIEFSVELYMIVVGIVNFETGKNFYFLWYTVLHMNFQEKINTPVSNLLFSTLPLYIQTAPPVAYLLTPPGTQWRARRPPDHRSQTAQAPHTTWGSGGRTQLKTVSALTQPLALDEPIGRDTASPWSQSL